MTRNNTNKFQLTDVYIAQPKKSVKTPFFSYPAKALKLPYSDVTLAPILDFTPTGHEQTHPMTRVGPRVAGDQ